MIRNRRLKQFGMSLVIVMSLFASTFAACACRRADMEDHTFSCHQMTGAMEESPNLSTDEAKKFTNISENCNCFAKISQPFVVNKSADFKSQKHPAILFSMPKVENTNLILTIVSVKTSFANRFYNSNYLRKLTPARAPPVV